MFKKLVFVFMLVIVLSVVPLVVFAQGPDFSGTISPAEIRIFSGTPITFTLTVANNSGQDAPVVYANNTFLPAELQLDEDSIVVSSGVVTPTTEVGYTMIWWSGPIADGDVVTITYQATGTVAAGQSALNILYVGDARSGAEGTLVGTIGTGGTFVPDRGVQARVYGPMTLYLPIVMKNYSTS